MGSVPHKNKESSLGGTTILLHNLLLFLEGRINFTFISFNRFCFKGAQIINIIYSSIMLLFYLPFSKSLMINTSRNGAFYVAPLVYLYCKIFRVKFIFRMFGGNLLDLIKSKNKFLVSIFFKTVVKADLILVETKALVKYMGNLNDNVKVSNVRKLILERLKLRV